MIDHSFDILSSLQNLAGVAVVSRLVLRLTSRHLFSRQINATCSQLTSPVVSISKITDDIRESLSMPVRHIFFTYPVVCITLDYRRSDRCDENE